MTRYKFVFITAVALLALIITACSAQTIPTEPLASIPITETKSSIPTAVPAKPSQTTETSPSTESPTNGLVWVANGMEDSLSAIDTATGNIATTVPVGTNPHILNISPDGSLIYVINAGEHDRDPNAHAEEETEVEDASEDEHHGSDVNEDNMDNTNMSMDTEVNATGNSLWAVNSQSGEIIARVPVGTGPTHPMPSPDGKVVYVTNTDEDSVSIIDTTSWETVSTIHEIPEPHDGELTPDGRFLYLASSGDNTMTVVDTNLRQVVQTFPVGTKPRGVAVGGDNGELAYVTNKGDGTLSVINVPAGEVVGTYPIGEGAHAVRVSPDGQTLYIALSKEDSIAVVNSTTGTTTQTISVGKLPEQIDLSKDGRWLFASNNGDASVSIIDLELGEVVKTTQVGDGAYGIQATHPSTEARFLLSFPKNADGYSDISAVQLEEVLKYKNFTLINTHIPYAGDIPLTDLSIPFDQTETFTNQLPANKDAPLVVYCRSGSMSTQAAQTLVNMGYTNVLEVDGGMNAWQNAGYELVMNQ